MTDCKHDWHFLPNTDRLQCRRCKAETGPRETEGAEPVQAPWTEDLVRDALTWGTAWNMGGKRIDPMSVYAVPTAQLQGYKLHDSRPNSIRFYSPGDTTTEVLRISKDGVWANPDVPTDEAAKKVLEALDSNIKSMIERMRKEELDKCCDLLEGMHVATDGNHNYYLHAANELRKLRAGK